MRIFKAVGATRVTTKNIFATASITAPSDVQNAYSSMQGVFKGRGQVPSAEVTHRVWLDDVPSMNTFAFEGVNRMNVMLLCVESDSGECRQDGVIGALLDEGKSYFELEDRRSTISFRGPCCSAFFPIGISCCVLRSLCTPICCRIVSSEDSAT